ncbi:macro domain-containing protein [Pseudoxanthobacter sp.]|uniref:macro domain-containing protein n=1 Tax=Pseudoxanthobacter sp. TaxID=1925742 RepID=UPI002FE38CF6
MLFEVEGDILLSRAQAIAHGVAPNDHFNNGLALALHEKYPAMAKEFRHYCQQNSPEPGEAHVWGGAAADGQPVHIVSLMTQEPAAGAGGKPGKATLPHVNHALKALARIVRKEKFTSLAMPRLATGVGGLAWEDVKPLLEKHLGDLDIPIYVYVTFHAGMSAAEKVPATA